MPIPIMVKFLGLIVACMIFASPLPDKTIVNERSNLENAQIIADRSGKVVNVWMNGFGHVNIQYAEEKPIEPYTILHSTWVPRNKKSPSN